MTAQRKNRNNFGERSANDLRRVIAHRNRAIEAWVARHNRVYGGVLDFLDGMCAGYVGLARRLDEIAAMTRTDPAAGRSQLVEIAKKLRGQANQLGRMVDKERRENRRLLESARNT
ncbi:MAG TPA: hypothetical protein VFA80_10335 [Xanthobacteraceae bacterium]|nr:hypothetical protein [Xanthobacteraceae bacterium]